ncbi:MAG: protein kinase [Gemmatimonadales bacterium]
MAPAGARARGDELIRWETAEAILDRALDLPEGEREEFVRGACGEDDELRRAVLDWLAACEAPTLFPDSPAAVYGAGLLPDENLGRRLGPFRIVELLGRGGMGAVYLAERDDGQFEQRVAVKLIRAGAGDDRRLRGRFLEERQILARLDHPHIATFIDGGITPDGRPYFVMQHVAGIPIDRYCDEHRLTVDERLELFLTVCEAVAYAHQRQIVHRDLKPGNVLVTEDGHAKLLDFGIAKLLDPEGAHAEAGLTRTGERLLTPEFASPEQVRGDPVTPASDVYALGVMLHRLLSGRGPYRSGPRTPHDVERAVLEDDPVLPSEVAGSLDDVAAPDPDRLRRLRGDLDTIVLTALRKDPLKRYASAGELGEELRRHLRGEPVDARRRSRAYRAQRFLRRHRARIGAALGVAGAAAIFAVGRWTPGIGPSSASLGGGAPVLAIGRLADYREAGDGGADAVADMLATNLARIRGLGVVSSARMLDLVQQIATGNDAPNERFLRAARLAGADRMLEGAIYANEDGTLRLDLRSVDLASGGVEGAVTATGATLFAVADSATARLALDLGFAPPSGSIADVTTRSLAAYRLYTEGLERFTAGDQAGADEAFEAALAEDSTFAMAAYYSVQVTPVNWRSASATEAERAMLNARMERALRLSDRASDRERLIARSFFALLYLAPDMSAVAETLAVRYPQEVFGHLALAQSLGFQGRFTEAIPYFRRVVAMDSASMRNGVANCRACEAMNNLTESYMLADSLDVAEQMTRRWLDVQPTSDAARRRLADILDGAGRYAETEALLAGGLDATRPDLVVPLVKHWIRAGELDRADSMLAARIPAASGAERSQLLYFRAVTLRDQGRLAEALAVAGELRRASGETPRGSAAPPSAIVAAQMLFDAGRYRASAMLFDSIARWPGADGQPATVRATQRVVALSMAAAARYADGDTAGLAALADSLAGESTRLPMFQPRDQGRFVAALLQEARGEEDAAIAAFGASPAATASDFGRANRQLALVFLRRGRPEEAVRLLRLAARGWFLETSNLHMGLTEVHELLAEALDAAGAADSAAVHWGRVARSWERADPPMQPRRARAAERAASSTR